MTSPTDLRPLDRATAPAAPLPVRVLQFGAGNFLRAFVDQMIQLSNEAGVTDAGVAVVHATQQGAEMLDVLRSQDCRYHVLLRGVDAEGNGFTETTLVTAIQDAISCYTDYDAYLRYVLSEDLRVVVSNTTEAGIVYVEGEDLSATPPSSFPGKVTALLHERWKHFDGDPARGLAFLPCELIESNGTTLRAYVLRHAAEAGLPAEFVAWVESACTFYDTLVDRIVPGFPAEQIGAIQADLGLRDNLVVVGEHYGSWAIAGPAGIEEILPLDRAGLGVTFMPDIRTYRETKVRLLNGAHTAMASVGIPLGCETVLEADRHPLLGDYVRRLVHSEVLPTVAGDPAEAAAFAEALVARFANPALKHRLADIGLNSLAKWRTRNLPTLLDRWAAGAEAPLTSASLAYLLARYAEVVPGSDLVRDDVAEVAQLRAAFDADDPTAWLTSVLGGAAWGLEPDQVARLAREAGVVVSDLLTRGPEAVLASILEA